MDPVEFVPGAEDLEVNLWTGGSLQAVVMIDEEIALENLWLQVEPTEGQVPEPTDTRLAIMNRDEYRLRGQFTGKEDGRYTFQWNSLWPGGYRFEVTARGASVPLVEVLDLQIVAGERNEDARLDGIDLRGKFRMIVVRVVGTNGRPIPEANYGPPLVVINNRTEDAVLGGYAAQDGSASILTRERYVDLLVLQRGYKPVELNGITSDTTVTLEPFPEVVVRIAGGLPRLPGGHALRVSLSKKGRQRDRRRLDSNFMMGGNVDMWLRPTTASQVVGDSGEIRLQVEGDGAHTVRVSLRNNSTRRSSTVRDIEPAEIEMRASLGEQVFEIRIPEEGLRAAIERAAGR
jgi:hypothetical protein